MNNNRQPNNSNNSNNNRRRGRSNNNRPQSSSSNNSNRNGFDYQNRIDNRARGNASQMLEKYKKLASDAQHNDDRVNSEYYLQFADHYFRVLADFRSRQEARQEERRPNSRDDARDDIRDGARDYEIDETNIAQDVGDTDYQTSDAPQYNNDAEAVPERTVRTERGQRRPHTDRTEKTDRPEQRTERTPRRERTARPQRRHHSEESGEDSGKENNEQNGLDLAVLPPAISIAPVSDAEEAATKPARKPRARKPKTDASTATAE